MIPELGYEKMLSGMWEGGGGKSLVVYLFLGSTPSTLGKLAGVIHGRGTATRWLAVLTTLWVEHPPWAFPRSLVLHSHKATVQRQVVPDRVLRMREGETVMTTFALFPVNSVLMVYHHSANPHSSCFLFIPCFWPFLSLSTNLHRGLGHLAFNALRTTHFHKQTENTLHS